MKHLPLALLIVAGIWLASIALRAKPPTYTALEGEVPAQLSSAPPAGFVVRSFEVEGMCCRSCTRGLHERLLAVEGVSEAAVSFEASSAAALAPADVPAERLLEALNFGKYTARLSP